MQSSRGLFRVVRTSPYVRLNVKDHFLHHRRLFNHESIRNPEQKGRMIYRTAILTGTLVVGGFVIKLTSRPLESYTNDEDQERKQDNDPYWRQASSLSLSEAIKQSRDLLQVKKIETGCPGLTVAVSVDGKIVWAEGLGYSDVENRVKCTPQSIFRIASISKSITMAAVAKLIENGDLDLDKPVQYYVPEFPEKSWDGQKVEITTRQLLSHVGGIRHYWKDYMTKTKETKNDGEDSKKTSQKSGIDTKVVAEEKKKGDKNETKNEMSLEEYYITKHYNSVQESLALFKDDPLVHKPGTKYMYTTHGWTLISAVVEKAAKMPFEKLMMLIFDELGLENTYLEENQPLIKNRGRHYEKNKKGHIENAPYVDLSYKWAGGGFISNVLDLTQFGNAMLFSYQARTLSTVSRQRASSNTAPVKTTVKTEDKESEEHDDGSGKLSGYLKPDTMKMIWTPVVFLGSKYEVKADDEYGMGWRLCSQKHEHAFGKDEKFYATHTGGAVGASSVLLILPTRNSQLANETTIKLEHEDRGSVKSDHTVKDFHKELPKDSPPNGVVVAIIVNLTSVGLRKTAYDIAKMFEQVDFKM